LTRYVDRFLFLGVSQNAKLSFAKFFWSNYQRVEASTFDNPEYLAEKKAKEDREKKKFTSYLSQGAPETMGSFAISTFFLLVCLFLTDTI
jgi:hypothetical protein